MKQEIKKITLFFTGVILFVLVYSCTDESGAKKTLERNGYSPIDIGGYGWFAGSKDDVYRTNFKAIAPNGDTVTGCVTSGWFKGNTVRID